MWPCRFALLKNVGLACSNYPVWPLQVTQGVFINDQLIIRKSAHSTQDTAKTGTATSPAPKITWAKGYFKLRLRVSIPVKALSSGRCRI